ncbi:MAG: hypothetical protein KDA71_00770, partial [Planctomycetales bacterium]|nr:hypothetical protein [Planctomycetales bacterium]
RFAGEQRRRPRRLNGWPTRVNDEREHQPKGCFQSGSREDVTEIEADRREPTGETGMRADRREPTGKDGNESGSARADR